MYAVLYVNANNYLYLQSISIYILKRQYDVIAFLISLIITNSIGYEKFRSGLCVHTCARQSNHAGPVLSL